MAAALLASHVAVWPSNGLGKNKARKEKNERICFHDVKMALRCHSFITGPKRRHHHQQMEFRRPEVFTAEKNKQSLLLLHLRHTPFTERDAVHSPSSSSSSSSSHCGASPPAAAHVCTETV